MPERPEMLNENKKASPLVIVFSTLLSVLLVVSIGFLAFRLWFNANHFIVDVDGSSMEQTLSDGDELYARKSSKAKRGDIVIINVKNYSGNYSFSGDLIIKRVIATEGDSVRIADGGVEIMYAGTQEFVPLEEAYAYGETEPKPFHDSQAEWTVGTGEIFFLGDNRSISQDSRYVGCFSTDTVIGIVPDWAVKHKKQAKNDRTESSELVKIAF